MSTSALFLLMPRKLPDGVMSASGHDMLMSGSPGAGGQAWPGEGEFGFVRSLSS